MDFIELEFRCREHFCIPVVEDYGYRNLIWFPAVSEYEIESFWASLGSLDWAPDNSIAGEWWPGLSGEEDDSRFIEIFDSLWNNSKGYIIAFDGNLAGALLTPTGNAVFHKGSEADEGECEEHQLWAKRRIQSEN